MSTHKAWVSMMLETINEAMECEGYRLTECILPPSVWDGIAIGAIGTGAANVTGISLAVNGGKVTLTRGTTMAIETRAVPV